MRVLAIDQGTSATKALVVDEAGTVIGSAEVELDVIATPDGGVEVDPEALWSSIIAAGEHALAAAGGGLPDAIGLANQGETVLAWSPTDARPLSRAIVWQDRRSVGVCDRLRSSAPWLAAITGLELDPYFVAPKMSWLREHGAIDGVISTTDTWILRRLTGAYVTDVATASRALLLDLDTATWSAPAAALFGIDASTLPAIVSCASAIGETTAFGGRAVPVTGACVDQQAALFAERCRDVGQAKCTYGTGAFLLACTGTTPTRSRHGLVGCVAWRLGDDDPVVYCLDGQVYTVGAAVGWLEALGLINEPADLDRVGGSVEGTAGVTFVPGLAGLGAPFWKPNAKGSFSGLSLATSRAHIVRSVIEGIAAQVAWLARAAGDDMGAPLSALRVDGGLTRSHTLLQTQADLLQVPVEVYPSPHATALGVAAMARLGSGAADLPPDAVSMVVEPQISADEAEERLVRWRRAAEVTADL